MRVEQRLDEALDAERPAGRMPTGAEFKTT
jgi:hypothetical protein